MLKTKPSGLEMKNLVGCIKEVAKVRSVTKIIWEEAKEEEWPRR